MKTLRDSVKLAPQL